MHAIFRRQISFNIYEMAVFCNGGELYISARQIEETHIHTKLHPLDISYGNHI